MSLSISQEEETILSLRSETWVPKRASEIKHSLDFLLRNGYIRKENLRGRIIDLGTGSGAGLVALRNLGATQIVGVEDERELRDSLEKIGEGSINPYKAFSPADSLKSNVLRISNERFLEIAQEERWKISLVTCFWIHCELPVKQIEKVLIADGQVIVTATKRYSSHFKESIKKANFEIEEVEVPGHPDETSVDDRFVLVGTKITSRSSVG